jgi:Cytochrome c
MNRNLNMRNLLIVLAITAVTAGPAIAQDQAAMVARGKYLAEDVGVCQDCHTPRLETGELDTTKSLKGATLGFGPLQPMEHWHENSPDLTPTGRLFKRWGPEGIVNFLMTGKNPRGGTAGPPMPTYKMSHDDAMALVEYLKTLP